MNSKGKVVKKCDLCGSAEFSITIQSNINHSDITKCNNCGLVFSNPQVDIHYETNRHFQKYMKQEKGRRLTAQWRLDQIEKHIKPGNLLEIGCCGGLLLDEASKRGWNVTGTEISKKAVDYGRNHLKLDIIDSVELSSINFNKRFDVVILFDVLEHLSEPSYIINYISNNLLMPNGLIAVEIPNINTFYTPFLKYINLENSHFMFQHYFYFSKKTYKKFTDKHNLDIIDFRYGKRIYPLEYCFDRLLKRNELIQQSVLRLLRKLRLDQIYVNASLHEFFFYICKNH